MAAVDLSAYDKDTMPNAEDMAFGIVVSDWNDQVTHSLLQGAYETLIANGALPKNIHVYHVPGSFELIYASQQISNNCDVDAVIALGCVVRGGTPHFDYVCQGVTQGITQVNLEADCPVIFSVLTTLTMQQATDRAGGCLGNKGVEGAVTALKMVKIFGNIK